MTWLLALLGTKLCKTDRFYQISREVQHTVNTQKSSVGLCVDHVPSSPLLLYFSTDPALAVLILAVSVGKGSFKHSRHSFFDDPLFHIGAFRRPSLVLAHMLTGEREIPTQDDLFSWKFSPTPSPDFTVNGQCLSVNSLLHHSPSTGQLAS